ncbi:MAG: hypothetical protein OEV30_07425 [Ignavibacteria bacterium]|nr:hypothetical protein [Ignavibacteria bacterium]
MDKHASILLCCGFLLACGSSGGSNSGDELARDHMSLARAFESESRWQDAAMEYAIVGDLYPETSYYETAVRKAATLFSHPDNHSASDSTIFRWLREYSTLPVEEEERMLVESHISMLQNLRRTEQLLTEKEEANDSLAMVITAQQEKIESGAKRIRTLEKNLEKKLAQTKDELEKLREIDMKVGRDNGKE